MFIQFCSVVLNEKSCHKLRKGVKSSAEYVQNTSKDCRRKEIKKIYKYIKLEENEEERKYKQKKVKKNRNFILLIKSVV